MCFKEWYASVGSITIAPFVIAVLINDTNKLSSEIITIHTKVKCDVIKCQCGTAFVEKMANLRMAQYILGRFVDTRTHGGGCIQLGLEMEQDALA